MTLVALHAVQTAAVNRYHGALHVDQIVLTQLFLNPFNQRLCHIRDAFRKHSRRRGDAESRRSTENLSGEAAEVLGRQATENTDSGPRTAWIIRRGEHEKPGYLVSRGLHIQPKTRFHYTELAHRPVPDNMDPSTKKPKRIPCFPRPEYQETRMYSVYSVFSAAHFRGPCPRPMSAAHVRGPCPRPDFRGMTCPRL
jgi:hypothetical protein